MLRLLIAFVVALSCSSWAKDQRKYIKPQEQAGAQVQADHGNKSKGNTADEASAFVQRILSEDRKRESREGEKHGEDEGTEFWPTFYGYRLKITDTILSIFTALLFFATLALWWSTRRLVKGAEETAERQLRAYICVKAVTLMNFNVGSQPIFRVTFENTGQTPAYNVRSCIKMETFEIPLPEELPEQLTREVGFNLGAGQPSEIREPINVVIMQDDIVALTSNKIAIIAWGKIIYEDIFGKTYYTNVRCMYGGEAGVDPNGSMVAWHKGNEAT